MNTLLYEYCLCHNNKENIFSKSERRFLFYLVLPILSSTFYTVSLFVKGSVASTEAPTIKISPATAVQLPAN